MVSVNSVYQKVLLLTNKSGGAGYLVPEDFNNYIAMVNTDKMNNEFSRFQQTQKVTDTVKPFIVTKNIPISSNGKVLYPNDYYFFLALGTYNKDEYISETAKCNDEGITPNYNNITQVPIKLIDNDKFRVRNLSPLYAGNTDFPFATMYNDYIQVAPRNLGVCFMDYLKTPNTPIWGYTLDSFGLPIYDSATSTNFDWDENTENDLVRMVCLYFGLEVREYDFSKLVIQANDAQ